MKSFIQCIIESRKQSKSSLGPLDETECINICINDDMLKASKILCYGAGQTATDEKGKTVPVNPKKFPEKAIRILVPVTDEFNIEIFFSTPEKKWDS